MSRFYLIAVMLIVSTGCMTVGPDYEAPLPAVPDTWHTTATAGLAEGEASLQTWWTLLDDAQLNALIERAQEENLSLEAAVWRINEARALRGVSASAQMPQVTLDGSSVHAQLSDNGLQPPPEGGFDPLTLHDYNAGASWEIDLFGHCISQARCCSEVLYYAICAIYDSTHSDCDVALYFCTHIQRYRIGGYACCSYFYEYIGIFIRAVS